MEGIPAGRDARSVADSAEYYERRRPDQTFLYQIIEQHYPVFSALMAEQGRELPAYAQREFEDYLKCSRLEHGFLRVRCERCRDEKLVAFSCKRRGFCPGCGARRMVESAALLVDEVLPHQPMRQWVLSVRFAIRFLFAANSAVMGRVLGIVYRAIATHLIHKAGLTRATGQTGAVTLIQRFGSALNLNIHFHMLFLDGVCVYVTADGSPFFRRVKPPTPAELDKLIHRISHRVGRYLERVGLLVRDLGIQLPDAGSAGRFSDRRSHWPFHHLPDCGRAASRPEGIHPADSTGNDPGTRRWRAGQISGLLAALRRCGKSAPMKIPATGSISEFPIAEKPDHR